MARRTTERRRRQLFAEAARIIRERHSEFDLSLADIAEDAACSTRQLQRVFREVGETDFRSYLLEVRMEGARKLLSRERDTLTVREVARRVGYREASGLRQQFVRYFDARPSDVRAAPPDYDEFWRAAEEQSRA
jgi:AraC-like DNA-binding protein